MTGYGKELILDLHECDISTFYRASLEVFGKRLCKLVDMKQEIFHPWDDDDTPDAYKETEPHLIGYSGVHFIRTSNITIHAVTLLRSVHVNLFTCKEFDPDIAAKFVADWFCGKIVQQVVLERL